MGCWNPARRLSAATRYLIGVVADEEHVWAVLDAAFREFGLPKRYAPRLADAFSACLVQPLKSMRGRCLGSSVRWQRVVRLKCRR